MNSQISTQVCDCSIIIPTADRGDLLAKCLTSVFEQTLQAVSIIVVDNGRRDACIPEKYKESILLVRTAPRIGPGKARNVGARAATTEFIAFLDDDDYWEDDYLEKSYDACLKTGASIVVGQLKRMSSNGVLRPYKLMPDKEHEQRSVYFRNPGFGGQNIMLRRKFFMDVGGFDEKMPASVDRDLAARILQAGDRIYVEPRAVAVLCDHDGDRVRASQVKGNYMFIKKHWHHMTFYERFSALKTLIKRYVRRWLSKEATI